MHTLNRLRTATLLLTGWFVVLAVIVSSYWTFDLPKLHIVWPLLFGIAIYYFYIDRQLCPSCKTRLLRRTDVAVLKAPILRMTLHGRCLHCGGSLAS